MAIAPSKLGQFVSQRLNADQALLRSLRAACLVRPDVSDDALTAVFWSAREEHDAMPEDGDSRRGRLLRML